MDCNLIRDLVSDLWGGELPGEAREHVSKCEGCQAFMRDSTLLRAGFRALAEEPLPEASLGFASRLVRRLQDWRGTGVRSEFFETVGDSFMPRSP